MMLTTGTSAGRVRTLLRATPKAPTAIPSEPVIRRGLRPSFSTVNTATRVKVMLIMPIRTVWNMGSPMPMDSKIRGAKYSTAFMPIICWNTDSMHPINTTRKPKANSLSCLRLDSALTVALMFARISLARASPLMLESTVRAFSSWPWMAR